MKFPFQQPHLTSILHIKVSLLLVDIVTEAENVIEQNSTICWGVLSHICLSHHFLGRLSKIAIQIVWLQCQMDSYNYGSFRQSI